jgi:glutamate--cysteine ligase
MFWPDVRLKRFVEIRPADCMPPEDVVGYAALIKGLYYSEPSLGAIEDALGVSGDVWPLTSADVDAAIAAIARDGLSAEVFGQTLRDWEEMLFTLARGALPAEERHYLEPLVAFARDKDWWEVG